MSLVDSKRVHSRQLVELKEKGKLIIPSNVIDKIHYLHSKIKAIEWSAILVYEVVEGEVEKPETLVLRVKDFILMDIGNATYTEYEFSTDDDYSFTKYTDALENGYKIGHLHTHHTMNCFFSGTDTDELFDNSEKHNFYLSLIVNFKTINDWCAAVAMCVDEKVEGEIKEVGNIKVTRTYKGKEGLVVDEHNQEINNVKPIASDKSLMYKINLELVREGDVAFLDGLEERIASINESKKPKYHNYNYAHTQRQFDWDEIGGTGRGGASINSTFQAINKKEEEKEKQNKDIFKEAEMALDAAESKSKRKNPVLKRSKNCYSPANVRPVLIQVLNGNENMDLQTALINFITDVKNPVVLEYNLGMIEEKFASKCDAILEINGEDIDYHCLAVSFTDLLTPYEKSPILGEVTKLLLDAFDLYMDEEISPAMTKHFTGIELEDDSIETELLKNY